MFAKVWRILFGEWINAGHTYLVPGKPLTGLNIFKVQWNPKTKKIRCALYKSKYDSPRSWKKLKNITAQSKAEAWKLAIL